MKRELPDATAWTGSDLHAALLAGGYEYGDELEATLWGVPLVFWVWALDADGETCQYADGVVCSYVVDAYPADERECLGVPQTTASACMAEARRLLRDYAPPGAYDAHLLAEAQRSGVQPPLFAEVAV